MSENKTVLIAGASGRLGRAAMSAFARAGWRVLAQARQCPDQLPEGVKHLEIDINDVEALTAAAAGTNILVYAINPLYTRWDTDLLPIARSAMRIAHNLGATFMLPGNVYNYGASMPCVLTENTPQRPTSRKGKLRVDLEGELEAGANAKTGPRSVVIRAGDFFGGGRGTWLDLVVVKSLAKGKLVYPGPLNLVHPWAYLPDLASTFVSVAEKVLAASVNRDDLPPFLRFHFSGNSLTGAQALQRIEQAARQLGIAPAWGFKHGGMPWSVIRAGGLVVPMWREVAEMQYLWDVPHRLDDSALKKFIGDITRTDFTEAIYDSLIDLGLAKRNSVSVANI